MNNLNQKIKFILYPILYWIIFVIIPFAIANNLENYNPALNIPGVVGFYILFIAPFLFFIPYKLAKIKAIKTKFLFVFFGLIIPYFLLYIYIYYKIAETFRNSSFPF